MTKIYSINNVNDVETIFSLKNYGKLFFLKKSKGIKIKNNKKVRNIIVLGLENYKYVTKHFSLFCCYFSVLYRFD